MCESQKVSSGIGVFSPPCLLVTVNLFSFGSYPFRVTGNVSLYLSLPLFVQVLGGHDKDRHTDASPMSLLRRLLRSDPISLSTCIVSRVSLLNWV